MDTATAEEAAETTLMLAVEEVIADKLISALEHLVRNDPMRLVQILRMAEAAATTRNTYRHGYLTQPLGTVSTSSRPYPVHVSSSGTGALSGYTPTVSVFDEVNNLRLQQQSIIDQTTHAVLWEKVKALMATPTSSGPEASDAVQEP